MNTMDLLAQALGEVCLMVRKMIAELVDFIRKTFFPKRSIQYVITSKGKPALKNREIEQRLREYPNAKISSFDWDTGDESEAADAILEQNVDPERREEIAKALASKMRQIKGYRRLCDESEKRRLERYNSGDPKHEKLLMRLWDLLRPDEPLVSRKNAQWQYIGFQGDDPATDFRGMGMLGLDQLVFFASYDVNQCQKILSISHHPQIGFPYAICGISMTALAKELLFDNQLKNHFYNASVQSPTMDSFHQVYCRIFSLFADYWVHVHPASVMQFNNVRREFVRRLEAYLARADANLLEARLEDLIT